MIYFNDIGLSFGERVLFANTTLRLNKNNRYGVTGANGSGKSTLLKLIANQEQLTQGVIEMPGNYRVGFLQQDQFKYEQDKVIEVVIKGKPELANALSDKEVLLAKSDLTAAEGIKLAELEAVIADNHGYTAEIFAESILLGLGLAIETHRKPLALLSGGFKLRVLMAQALFKEPEVLLLDEPTNHLDIVATYWLEKFLINEYRGVLLMVSHDHDFLNNVATDILDLDYGRITGYKGNYDKFVVAKELAKTQKDIEIKENQRKIAHMQKFVDKNKAKASKAKQAMSRVKMIAKIKSPEALQSSRRCPNFKFQAKSRSGKQVVAVKDIWKSFNDRFVLAEATFNVNRGDKVAIIGPNGIGKSTLLKIMMNKLAADNGTVTWGHNVAISYFAQDHHERIKQSQSLLSWLQDNAVTSEDRVLRTALGNMLFTKDEVDKDVAVLSGGEVARLLFAEIQLAQNNVLVLDEPTNHLDMETIHGLAAALKSYEGTVIAVSHDRHFINSYCNRVIGIAANKVVDYCVQDWQDLNDILDKQCAVGVDLRVGPV